MNHVYGHIQHGHACIEATNSLHIDPTFWHGIDNAIEWLNRTWHWEPSKREGEERIMPVSLELAKEIWGRGWNWVSFVWYFIFDSKSSLWLGAKQWGLKIQLTVIHKQHAYVQFIHAPIDGSLNTWMAHTLISPFVKCWLHKSHLYHWLLGLNWSLNSGLIESIGPDHQQNIHFSIRVDHEAELQSGAPHKQNCAEHRAIA